MMSLVAYGSSGESENDSDNEVDTTTTKQENSAVNGLSKHKSSSQHSAEPSVAGAREDSKLPSVSNGAGGQNPSTRSGLHSKLPAPKTVIEEIIEEVDEEPGLAVGSMLPAPKHHTTPSLIDSSIALPRGPKDKGRKGPVKISIPSLSDVSRCACQELRFRPLSILNCTKAH